MPHVFDNEKGYFVQVHANKLPARPTGQVQKRKRNAEYVKCLLQREDEKKPPPPAEPAQQAEERRVAAEERRRERDRQRREQEKAEELKAQKRREEAERQAEELKAQRRREESERQAEAEERARLAAEAAAEKRRQAAEAEEKRKAEEEEAKRAEEEERQAAEKAEEERLSAEAAEAARLEGERNKEEEREEADAPGSPAAAATPTRRACESPSQEGSGQVVLRATPQGQLSQSYEMGFTDKALEKRLDLQLAKAEGSTPKGAEHTQATSARVPKVSPRSGRAAPDAIAIKDADLQRKLEMRKLRAEGRPAAVTAP